MANTNHYEFFDRYAVEIRGEGGRAVDQFRKMYGHFEVSEPDREPDIVCELSTSEPDPDRVLGGPNRYYGREGDRFVVREGPDYMSVDSEWSHVKMAPHWEPFNTIYLIEYEIRRRLAEEGFGLIHASGVQLDGRTFLCPAWRSAGKTNTLLALLAAGGDYLSDDRLWVNADGNVRGYPLSVNLQPHNVESFPGVADRDTVETLRSQAATLINETADPSRSIADKGFLYIASNYLEEQGREFARLDDLLAECEFVDRAEADSVVVLTAAPKATSLSVEQISTEDALRETTAISHYEWNHLLEEYFLAFDALFPSENKSGQFDALRAEEERIFSTLFDSVSTHRALVPRDPDWSESGLSDEVVDTFTRLNRSAAAIK